LEKIVEKAPHDPRCEIGGCNCWKARAAKKEGEK